jgi:hypothetical protein
VEEGGEDEEEEEDVEQVIYVTYDEEGPAAGAIGQQGDQTTLDLTTKAGSSFYPFFEPCTLCFLCEKQSRERLREQHLIFSWDDKACMDESEWGEERNSSFPH